MRFIGDDTLQIANLVALRSHLFGKHLDLEGQRLLVALQAAQTFIGVLALELVLGRKFCLELLLIFVIKLESVYNKLKGENTSHTHRTRKFMG